MVVTNAAGIAGVTFLLNSDTEVESTTVPRLLAAFEDDPSLGVAGAELHFPDGRPSARAPVAPS